MKRNKINSWLVDVLIAVVILAVLHDVAGVQKVLIPRCFTAPSKPSMLAENLQSIRAQLELYRLHHGGAYPADINTQLTSKTDTDGTINKLGAYGPYMQKFPANPFVDDPTQAVKAGGVAGEGWSYDSVTGAFAANTVGHENL